MHAIVHNMTVTDGPASRERLVNEVVPRVSLPGFVRGTWVTDTAAENGTALVIFDSLEGAERVAAGLRDPGHRHHDVVTTGVQVFGAASGASR